MKSSISFIIVAYHPSPSAVAAMSRYDGMNVIVVDNGATLTKKDIGNATLITPKGNIGYGAAANIGIRRAIADKAEWCVILNQDTSFTRGGLSKFIQKLTALTPCIAGPFTGGLDPIRWTTVLPSDRKQYISGSCMAIHANVVNTIGYFYEPYFLYYEEVDYCVRARHAGFVLQKLTSTGISHDESMSLGKGSITHQYYLSRNHLLFVERQAPVGVKLREYIRLPKTLWEHESRHEAGAFLGIQDYLFRRFGKLNGGRV